jgi:hypothetical protein
MCHNAAYRFNMRVAKLLMFIISRMPLLKKQLNGGSPLFNTRLLALKMQ